jgi:hypothetical protein
MDDLDFSYFEDSGFDSLENLEGFDSAEVYTAYDEPFFEGVSEFPGDGGIIQEQPGGYNDAIGENIFNQFLGAAKAKLTQSTSRPAARPETTKGGIGSGIFDAIYLYGKGKTELALESAIKKSSAGQKAIKNIEQERIRAWMPWIIGAAILLVLGGIFVARKR